MLSGKIKGSITNYFAEQANEKTPDELDDFVTFPAYNIGAIYDFNADSYYETGFADREQEVFRKQDIIQQGGINELTIAWAGEYKNNMNVGISIGVPFSSFEELKTYSETDPDDEIAALRNLEYIERLNTSGVGFNFKAGFTYKILNQIRFGGSFHSPTWYRFTDDYSTSTSCGSILGKRL